MKDIILTILFIAITFLGIPLAICFFKDWFILKKHGDLAPEGSRLNRIRIIEGQLNTRHTTMRGIFWFAIAAALAGWLFYKNLIWQPNKREWNDLFGVLWIILMVANGIHLMRLKGISKETKELPNNPLARDS